jgi:hypothetical protein
MRVMANDASANGAQNSVVTGVVTGDGAGRSTGEAANGLRR